jgi:hypothetical protein
MGYGLEQIKELEEIYLNSNEEIRDYILSRVIEIKSYTSCGLMILKN